MSREWEKLEDSSIRVDDDSEHSIVVESQIDRSTYDLEQCR